MCCAGGMVLSKNMTLCCGASIYTSRQLLIPILKTIPIVRDLVCGQGMEILTFF